MQWQVALLAAIAVALGCWTQPIDALRILALLPFKNNFTDAFARELAARGNKLDVYSYYPPKKPIANYKHRSLEGTLSTLSNNVNYSTTVQFEPSSNPGVVLEYSPHCKFLELPLLRRLLARRSKKTIYNLIIVEVEKTNINCNIEWGRFLGVPVVGMMASTPIDWYNEVTKSNKVAATFWQRIRHALSKFAGDIFTKFKALMIHKQDNIAESLFFPHIVDKHTPVFKNLDLLIVNIHPALYPSRRAVPAIVPVDGLHVDVDDPDTIELPEDVERWLDESEHGCVYFSFGSMIKIESFPKPDLQAFYRTFESIAPVRVLLKITSPKELPPGLPSNVMIQSWFPQLQVLKHGNTKAFVTHGGLLSVQEAIYTGVPMVIIPVFVDQHNDVEINVRKGIATLVQLDAIDEHKLTAAIKDVLYKPSYKRNIRKILKTGEIRRGKSLRKAMYWITYVAMHGRNCLEFTQAPDKPWWHDNLIGVHGLIIIFIIFILSIFIKWLMRLIF